MQYFSKCNTAEELKAEYKKLVMQLHPDKGGLTIEFQKMQSAYEKRLKELIFESKSNINSTNKINHEELVELIAMLLTHLKRFHYPIYKAIENSYNNPVFKAIMPYASPEVKEILALLNLYM